MSAPHGGLWIFYFWRVIAHGLAFAAVGPAIGLIFSPGVLLFPFSIPLAYGVSLGSAFAAGCCIGIATSFVRKPGMLYAIAAVIGAIFGAHPILPLTNPPFGNLGMWFAYMFAGAAAAVVCAYLFRNMRLHRDNPRWHTDR
jgi:hypothetical protein